MKIKLLATRWQTLERIGKTLEKLRHDAGLYRGQLSELSGIHQNTMGKYERGEVDPPLSVLAGLLEPLGYEIHIVRNGDQRIKDLERLEQFVRLLDGLPEHIFELSKVCKSIVKKED